MQFLGLTQTEAKVVFANHVHQLRQRLEQQQQQEKVSKQHVDKPNTVQHTRDLPTPKACQEWVAKAIQLCDLYPTTLRSEAVDITIPRSLWTPTHSTLAEVFPATQLTSCLVTLRYVNSLLDDCIISHRDVAAITVSILLNAWVAQHNVHDDVNMYRVRELELENRFNASVSRLMLHGKLNGELLTPHEISQISETLANESDPKVLHWTWVALTCRPSFEQNLWEVMVNSECCQSADSNSSTLSSSNSEHEEIPGQVCCCAASCMLSWMILPWQVQWSSEARAPLRHWVHNGVRAALLIAQGKQMTELNGIKLLSSSPLKSIGDGYWWLRLIEICATFRWRCTWSTRRASGDDRGAGDDVLAQLALSYVNFLKSEQNGTAQVVQLVECRCKSQGAAGLAWVTSLRDACEVLIADNSNLGESGAKSDKILAVILWTLQSYSSDGEASEGKTVAFQND